MVHGDAFALGRIEIYFAPSERPRANWCIIYEWESAHASERAGARFLSLDKQNPLSGAAEMAAYGDLRPPAGSQWKWLSRRHNRERMHKIFYTCGHLRELMWIRTQYRKSALKTFKFQFRVLYCIANFYCINNESGILQFLCIVWIMCWKQLDNFAISHVIWTFHCMKLRALFDAIILWMIIHSLCISVVWLVWNVFNLYFWVHKMLAIFKKSNTLEQETNSFF